MRDATEWHMSELEEDRERLRFIQETCTVFYYPRNGDMSDAIEVESWEQLDRLMKKAKEEA